MSKKKPIMRASLAACLFASVFLVLSANADADSEVIRVAPGNAELFSQAILQNGETYELTITGTFEWSRRTCSVTADALYARDYYGNYNARADNIAISPQAYLVAFDRAAHRYTYRVEGNGQRLSFLFIGWRGHGCFVDGSSHVTGALRVELKKLKSSTVFIENLIPPLWDLLGFVGVVLGLVTWFLIFVVSFEWLGGRQLWEAWCEWNEEGRRRWLEGASERERQAELAAIARRDTQRQREERDRRSRIEALRVDFEKKPHYEDEQFLSDHARQNKANLLRRAQEIRNAYRALNADPKLVAQLKQEHPEILRRATWETEALNRAEVLDSRPRKRLDPREFRDRLLRRQSVQNADKIELAKGRVKDMQKVDEMLDGFELDEADRATIRQEILEDLLRGDSPKGKVL